MTTIVLATGNPHKVEELREIFAAIGGKIEVLGLRDLPGNHRFTEPVEHGKTFEANARIKAMSYAMQTGRVCLADDSGLEIDALDGKPGVISSHYCTDGVEKGMTRAERDEANNARVLREMESVPEAKRNARFVCCMCLVDAKKQVLHESRGTMEGRIGVPPRVPSGRNGFGYDPLFLVAPKHDKTGAELASGEKNRVSHRASAAERMAEWVKAHGA